MISAYYGVEPGGTLIINGVPVLPSKVGQFGKDSCLSHFRNYNRNIAILHCFDEKTEIFTDQGFKYFKYLDGSEKVAQYNEKGKYLEFVKPKKYFVLPYEGKMYSLESRDLSLLVTPNHALYTKKRGKNNYVSEFPNELLGKRRKYLKIANWKDKDIMMHYRRVLNSLTKKLGWTASNNKTKLISITEKRFADMLQEIAIKAGYSCDIYREKRKGKLDPYIISIKNKDFTEVRPNEGKGKDKFIDFKGLVYCVKVPHGLILIRRNGKISVQSNTNWWAFPWFPSIPITALHSPMDHENYPEELIEHTKHFTYITSFCRWQQETLRKKGIESTYIPHGVDTDVYHPISRSEARKITTLPEDKFIFGVVGANSDKEGRKGWAPMFKALRYWLDENTDVKDVIVVAHSVPSDSPIIIRKNGLLDIIPIYSLFTKWKHGTEIHKLKNIEVLSSNGFTSLLAVHRHPTQLNKILQIKLRDSIIETTPNHSLFDLNLNVCKAEGLSIGDKIKTIEFPFLSKKTDVTENLAWILGLFVADGTINGNRTIIDNQNIRLLEKAKLNFIKTFGLHGRIQKSPSMNVSRLIIESKGLSLLFKKWCYIQENKNRFTKKIPNIILNSSRESILSFLDGYNAGDGIKSKKVSYKFQGFTTVSKTVATGLCLLIERVLEQNYTVQYDREKNAIKIKLNKPHSDMILKPYNQIIKINSLPLLERNSKGQILHNRSKYLYDLETIDGSFVTGVGHILAHNTNPFDPRGLPLTRFVHKQGLDSIVKFQNPKMVEIGLREEDMAVLYNAFDVLLHPSMREGFGMCIAEAQACGTPVIGTRFSSMTELIDGHGWLVKGLLEGLNILTTPINADTQIPDVYDIVKKIDDAYFNVKRLIKYGKDATNFMKQYEWGKIVQEDWLPFLKMVEDDLTVKTLDQRRIV